MTWKEFLCCKTNQPTKSNCEYYDNHLKTIITSSIGAQLYGFKYSYLIQTILGAEEYTDCISAEG